MLRVPVNREVLRWAIARSGKDEQALTNRFPKLPEWLRGELQPTWRQAQEFADATYTPIGYLYLDEPPTVEVPIADLRTVADRGVVAPSPNLLETIYTCQQRQSWFQDHALLHNLDAISVVGSARIGGPETVVDVASRMREHLGFDIERRFTTATFEQALRDLVRQVDAAGIMVMTSGIVGSNTHRPLDPEEFRGFALADPLAPLVFINGKSSKSAQMFTLAHELAHIWLGLTALSDADAGVIATKEVERWCNRVAAEFLVPMNAFREQLRPGEDIKRAARRLSRSFKVSTLVIIRRFYEAGELSRTRFQEEYEEELGRLANLMRAEGGGDYYRTQRSRLSERFVRAVIVDTLEGHTLYRDAMRLLGTNTVGTLHEMGRRLGIEA